MTILRVIDLESTGLAATDEVIEVAFYDVIDGALDVKSGRSALVRPAGLIPAVSSAVHHITYLDVKDAKPWADVWPMLAETPDVNVPLVLAAHMASFERQWIDRVMPGLQWIDTWRCSLRQWPEFESHSLQAMRYELALPADPALAMPPHRAAPDAYLCGILLIALLKHQTVETLLTWSGEPPLFTIVDFGKHRGTLLTEVDGGYLDWLANKEHTMGDDWRWNAKREIQRRVEAPEIARAAERAAYVAMALAAIPGAASVRDLNNWYLGQSAEEFALHGIVVGTDELEAIVAACALRKKELVESGEPNFERAAVPA